MYLDNNCFEMSYNKMFFWGGEGGHEEQEQD